VQEPLSVFVKPTSRVKSLLDKEDMKRVSLHILDFRVVSRRILLAIAARDTILDSDTPDRLVNSPLTPKIACQDVFSINNKLKFTFHLEGKCILNSNSTGCNLNNIQSTINTTGCNQVSSTERDTTSTSTNVQSTQRDATNTTNVHSTQRDVTNVQSTQRDATNATNVQSTQRDATNVPSAALNVTSTETNSIQIQTIINETFVCAKHGY